MIEAKFWLPWLSLYESERSGRSISTDRIGSSPKKKDTRGPLAPQRWIFGYGNQDRCTRTVGLVKILGIPRAADILRSRIEQIFLQTLIAFRKRGEEL